jgi:hypothetical protein
MFYCKDLCGKKITNQEICKYNTKKGIPFPPIKISDNTIKCLFTLSLKSINGSIGFKKKGLKS